MARSGPAKLLYLKCDEAQSRRLYKALTARDPRFDGIFFVGVTSTGIYCRPICPAKTPKQTNCRFFDSPQQAEQAGFRPCLRCRPELAPGSAPVDDSQRIAHLIVQRIEEGGMEDSDNDGLGIHRGPVPAELAPDSPHHPKRIGVSPIQLILTRRLLLAKQLLTETSLPVTDIAFASGAFPACAVSTMLLAAATACRLRGYGKKLLTAQIPRPGRRLQPCYSPIARLMTGRGCWRS